MDFPEAANPKVPGDFRFPLGPFGFVFHKFKSIGI